MREYTFSDLMSLVDYEALKFIADSINLEELDGELRETKVFEGEGVKFCRRYEEGIFVYHNGCVIHIKGSYGISSDRAGWWDKEQIVGYMYIKLFQSKEEQRAGIMHELVELELTKKTGLTNLTGFPKDLGHEVSCEYEKRYKEEVR